jgi:hypothetical protein
VNQLDTQLMCWYEWGTKILMRVHGSWIRWTSPECGPHDEYHRPVHSFGQREVLFHKGGVFYLHSNGCRLHSIYKFMTMYRAGVLYVTLLHTGLYQDPHS